MADRIRVGLVGASPQGTSWGARAHVPALKSLPDYELKAICTAHEDTARRAADVFGAELAFHDYNAMFGHPDIDLVAVAVRVPYHHEITMAALAAGKNVYCEWPLGANTKEAAEMTERGEEKGLITMVGLQARSDPEVCYLRDLIGQGTIGDVVACHMTLIGAGSLERTSARAWQADRTKGANTMTITGGHNIDALTFCLGDFAEVSAKVATQAKELRLSDTGELLAPTSPDNVLVNGVLESGALASIHIGSVPYHGSGGWRMDVYGTEGTLVASGGQANYSQQPLRLMLGRGKDALAEIQVPDEYRLVPEGTPDGAPYNVAQAYARLADGLRAGESVDPNFATALRLHRLLDAMVESSDEGRTITVGA